MAVTTRLPLRDGVGLIGDDATLATGILTIKDATVAIKDIKMTDIIDWSVADYAAGTAEIATINFNAATLVANTQYSLTVRLPNVVDFFGGGRESRAMYTTRTYTISTDAAPTANEVAAAFKARMDEDTEAGFTATVATHTVTITAQDATAGAFEINVSNITGTVVTATTPNVLPVGTIGEVQQYVPTATGAGTYDRYIIKYRKYIRHNAVKGLHVVKEENLLLYALASDNLPTTLTPLLNGSHGSSYANIQKYLGAPTA
jgi:hypothetical protein